MGNSFHRHAKRTPTHIARHAQNAVLCSSSRGLVALELIHYAIHVNTAHLIALLLSSNVRLKNTFGGRDKIVAGRKKENR